MSVIVEIAFTVAVVFLAAVVFGFLVLLKQGGDEP